MCTVRSPSLLSAPRLRPSWARCSRRALQISVHHLESDIFISLLHDLDRTKKMTMQAFGDVATQESISAGVRKSVALTVESLQAQYGEQMLSCLPVHQRSALLDLTNLGP